MEDQAEDHGHRVRDARQPYFSIDTGSERYDLIYLPTRQGLQAVARYDTEQGKTLNFHKINDILEGETS